MAMLTAYFDESGVDGKSPIVVVAGYISTVELWQGFQNEWQLFLDNNNLEFFHPTDLLSPYSKLRTEGEWSEKRVKSALRILDRLISKYVLHGAASYASIKECERVYPLKDKNHGKRKPYSMEYFLSGTRVADQA